MDSICGLRPRCHFLPSFAFFSRPKVASPSSLSFGPARRRLPLRASCAASRSHPHPSPGESPAAPLLSLLRPACVALTAAAALFLARLHNPSLALALAPPARSETLPSPPPPAADSGTLSDQEKEKALEEHLASQTGDAGALRALMEIKIKSGKFSEAVAIVDRLIALEPGEKDLPLLKAHIQSYGGNAETAKQGFEEILHKEPTLVEAYHGLVMAAWQSESEADLEGILKRIEGAMELCKKEKRKDDLRDFKLLVAQVKVLEGDYSDALRVYQDLVKEEPRDFRPYLCQGIVYTLLRKKDEAEKQFQKYRRLVPKEHPYAQYFDENMVAMKVFSQIDDNKRTASLKR